MSDTLLSRVVRALSVATTIRISVADTPVEFKLWRVAVWLAWFGTACLIFDSFVWSWWVDVPVEGAFVPFFEWLFPALNLRLALAMVRQGLRDLKRLRAELRDLQKAADR
jgi:hypothetical protein